MLAKLPLPYISGTGVPLTLIFSPIQNSEKLPSIKSWLNFHLKGSDKEIKEEAEKNSGELFSEKLFREQLAFHKDIDYSEPVEFLLPPPSETEIKQFLIDSAINIDH